MTIEQRSITSKAAIVPTVHTQADRHRTPSEDVARSLLDAAVATIESEGIDGLTVRAVADRADVAPMGVYSRFAGKAGLVDAVLVEGFTRLATAVDVRQSADARGRLIEACHAYRLFALEHPHLYRLMLLHKASVVTGEGVDRAARTAFGVLEGLVADHVELGAASPGAVTSAAQQLWAALHGAVCLELAGIDFTGAPAITYTGLVEWLLPRPINATAQ